VLVTTRGGAYGPGTPREGWDHSTDYLRRILADVWGADLTVVEREFTLVGVNPALDEFSELAAQMKTQLEHATLKDIIKSFQARIRSFESLKAKLIKDILTLIKVHPDLAARLELLRSVPGFGPVVAIGALVRMPELGAMTPGQAASLLGVAPFDRDSGKYKGMRFIAGGRDRPRRMIYMAALAATRSDPGLKAFAQRLADKGKPPKLVLVAVMRKLIEAANLVLARGQPWIIRPAS